MQRWISEPWRSSKRWTAVNCSKSRYSCQSSSTGGQRLLHDPKIEGKSTTFKTHIVLQMGPFSLYSQALCTKLQHNKITHTSYSTDLTSANFFLFPKLKTALRERQFLHIKNIKKNYKLQSSFFCHLPLLFCEGLERCKKCVAVKGGYLEWKEIAFYFKCICSCSTKLWSVYVWPENKTLTKWKMLILLIATYRITLYPGNKERSTTKGIFSSFRGNFPKLLYYKGKYGIKKPV